MNKGTIVLTKFPFTDLSSAKRRPAVILSKVQLDDPDVIVAFISSVLPDDPSPTDFVLRETDLGFSETGLKKSSVFKMDKLATLDKGIFSGEMGQVPKAVFDHLRVKLRIALDL